MMKSIHHDTRGHIAGDSITFHTVVTQIEFHSSIQQSVLQQVQSLSQSQLST